MDQRCRFACRKRQRIWRVLGERCITCDGAVEDADDAEGVAVVVHGAEMAAGPDLQHVGDARGSSRRERPRSCAGSSALAERPARTWPPSPACMASHAQHRIWTLLGLTAAALAFFLCQDMAAASSARFDTAARPCCQTIPQL